MSEHISQDQSTAVRRPVSAIVVSYNRAQLIEAVLQAVQFCDEVILVDKSSTDETRNIAVPLCDKVIQVPWSPTVEETRSYAVAQAANEWIVMLDDDEILNPAAAAWIEKELEAPRAQVYALPQRHYIMGIHDPHAYYWPEHQIRFFNKKAVAFTDTVHGGIHTGDQSIHQVDLTTEAGIEHLSHPDVATWIEKANRYTSRPDRVRPEIDTPDLMAFAAERLAYWTSQSHIQEQGDYPQAAGLLRATYDLIDRLKMWEEAHGLQGKELFVLRAGELIKAHVTARVGKLHPRRKEIVIRSDVLASKVTDNFVVKGDLPRSKEGSERAEIIRLWRELDSMTKRARLLEFKCDMFRKLASANLAATFKNGKAWFVSWLRGKIFRS